MTTNPKHAVELRPVNRVEAPFFICPFCFEKPNALKDISALVPSPHQDSKIATIVFDLASKLVRIPARLPVTYGETWDLTDKSPENSLRDKVFPPTPWVAGLDRLAGGRVYLR
ncbi:MAG: hypothetical protein V2B19_16795 [Pseudomonadota bacterium]